MELLRILTGPTASGKSVVGVRLAQAVNGEIVSVDSMKIYRGLDIGTAKPAADVRDRVAFHMVDVVEPHETFTLVRYIEAVRTVVKAIEAHGRRPLFVGGTPLYLRGLVYGVFEGPEADWALRNRLMETARTEGQLALHDKLRGLDPVAAGRLHPNDLKRVVRAIEVALLTGRPITEHQQQYPAAAPAAPYRMVALRRREEDLRRRIDVRVERMFADGLVEETREVLRRGALSRTARKAIGYRDVIAWLEGERTLDETVESVKRNTWRLARKQRTWLKSFPHLVWVDVAPDEPPEETVRRVRRALYGPERENGIAPPERPAPVFALGRTEAIDA